MNPETSPFRPGQPVPIEFFVGRVDEIRRLHGMVKASTQGGFKIGFISGERGIGKSSLVSFVRHLSEQGSEVAGCHVFLGGVQGLQEMLRRTFNRLLKESMDKPWHGQIRSFSETMFAKWECSASAWNWISRTETCRRLPMTSFQPSGAHGQSQGPKSALFLILDDINGLAGSEAFANWLKSMVDEIATSRRTVPLCILVVGLEERRQELIENQPSLARVFELIDLAPWSTGEVTQFYETSFDS